MSPPIPPLSRTRSLSLNAGLLDQRGLPCRPVKKKEKKKKKKGDGAIATPLPHTFRLVGPSTSRRRRG